LSLRDSLSGLYNRQYVLRRLRELILVFYEKHLTFSALLIDVDRIKNINDTYGHACGDKIIHDLSEIFKSLTRESDICARWGGEEFIILFPEMDVETATSLAERVRTEVKNTIMMWEGKEIKVTISVSVTSYTTDDTLKTFISKVDDALYRDKHDKRDYVRRI
jgi:diguanylate cyclase (GGDEF)-like protein